MSNETGLTLITGKVIGIKTNNDPEDYGFGQYIIHSGDGKRYRITLNLPDGISPPNKYPAIFDTVICYAEGIDRVSNESYEYVGYSELSHVSTDDDVEEAKMMETTSL